MAAERGGPTGVPHKRHAARLARDLGGHPSHAQALLAAAVLLGHHSGMPDRDSGTVGALTTLGVLNDSSLDGEIRDAVRLLETSGLGNLLEEAQSVSLPEWLPLDEAAIRDPVALRRLDMFTRMTFSVLVDADYLDTDRHFLGATTPRMAAATDFDMLFDQFQQARSRMLEGVPSSRIGAIRESVYQDALGLADLGPGLFRLPAPTGSGKTLTAAGFALRHAAVHDLRHVIIAVPFTSITTQNAQVYRSLLDTDGHPQVLEHHSGVLDGQSGTSRWRHLAAQNWDAPVVVTTTVQLFESLLSNRPGKARRLHRLAKSVIILDEVQALPMPLLPVILDLLRTLVADYGTTVVLSTATQPSFWNLPIWSDFPAVSLVPQESALRKALRRVNYQWLIQPKLAWDDVAERLAAERQALAIVNTTSDAQLLHRKVQAISGSAAEVLHLSTRMCGAHRREVLSTVRHCLSQDLPVLLISTQVVEAGVDVDFPVVFRALAPAPSIAQAAGRANREGRLSGLGRVIVFDPQGGGSPGQEYHTATELTRQRFALAGIDPDDAQALEAFYANLYTSLLPRGQSAISAELQGYREKWLFRSAAEKFRMIDDTGVSVLVDYDDPDGNVVRLVDLLRSGDLLDSAQWRFLQTRTCSLPHRTAQQAVESGLAEYVTPPGHDGKQDENLLVWRGRYDPRRGIDPAAPVTAEEVIW